MCMTSERNQYYLTQKLLQGIPSLLPQSVKHLSLQSWKSWWRYGSDGECCLFWRVGRWFLEKNKFTRLVEFEHSVFLALLGFSHMSPVHIVGPYSCPVNVLTITVDACWGCAWIFYCRSVTHIITFCVCFSTILALLSSGNKACILCKTSKLEAQYLFLKRRSRIHGSTIFFHHFVHWTYQLPSNFVMYLCCPHMAKSIMHRVSKHL